MKVRFIDIPAAVIFFLVLPFASNAQTCRVHGRIFFLDSLTRPAQNVTIFNPKTSHGTISEENGTFGLSLKASVKGEKYTLEFSHIGYESILKEVTCKPSQDIDLGEIVLEEQLIMLPTAYVTPKYKTAADYILAQVRKRAKENRKAHPNYNATISYSGKTHHIPLISKVLPGIAEGAVKAAASMLGLGNCVRYAMDTDDLCGEASCERSVNGGSTRDYNARIVRSSTALPPKVEKELKGVFKYIDLFNFLYSDDCLWGLNNHYRYHFTHTGTYMWNGKYVDILKWKGKQGFLSATIHVVQDDWGILKIEAGYQDKMILCESRDRGDGVYMPVSLVVTPSFFPVIKASKIPKYIEDVNADKRIGKSVKKKIISVLEANSDKDIHPYIVGRISVRYH